MTGKSRSASGVSSLNVVGPPPVPPPPGGKDRSFLCLPVAALLLLFFMVSSKNENVAEDSRLPAPGGGVGTKAKSSNEWVASTKITTKDGTALIQGMVDDIAYYHCKAKVSTTAEVKNLVLLHGAKFTKEDWKKSGILSKLCADSTLQVTAVDLNVQADHNDLIRVLNALARESLVTQLPVTALVTPSASGGSVVDWIEKKTEVVRTLPQYVQIWIPVAANSVRRARQDSLKYLRRLKPSLSIVAVYGNLDEGGRISSELLERHAGADMVELQGTHPVYLDSPDDFVATVQKYIAPSDSNTVN